MKNEKMDDAKQKKRGRLIFIAIVSIFVVPLLTAYWLLAEVEEGGVWNSTQHGILVRPPQPLQNFTATAADGTPFTPENLQSVWTLAYRPVVDCQDACRQTLYHMRQVRLALGRDLPRVQELLLPATGILVSPETLAEHPQIKVLLNTAGFTSQLKHSADPHSTGLYLIDPLGNLMMIFPADTDPRDILKDLKKLLRISKVG
jgi:cytochrome oxidase Cu insertion factor (SCO1/SenC/PrrC family)